MSEQRLKRSLVEMVVRLADEYGEVTGQHPWTKGERTTWVRHASRGTVEALRRSLDRARREWGSPAAVIRAETEAEVLANEMYAIRRTQPVEFGSGLPIALKVACGLVGFLGGMLWGASVGGVLLSAVGGG